MVHILLGFLLLVPTGVRAGVILSSDPASGTPATTFLLRVSSTTGADVMSGFQLDLKVLPDAGASGTVTFATAQLPPNYIFASDTGLVTSNMGSELTANDFDTQLASNNPPGGTTVPMSPSTANLLSVTFSAPGASGTFGIYAVEGKGNTEWTDPSFGDNFFDNVPDGTGMDRIGEIVVAGTIPEPSSWVLLGLGCAILGWHLRKWNNHRIAA